jgi:hypothetical protein
MINSIYKHFLGLLPELLLPHDRPIWNCYIKGFCLEGSKIENLLISIRDKSGSYAVGLSSFLARGWIRCRQHSTAEHCPLPHEPQTSGATEYNNMGMSIYHIYSYIPDSIIWDIFIFGFLEKNPTNYDMS